MANQINTNTVKLSNGGVVDVRHGKMVWVKGEVEFSKIVSKYTADEIIANNKARQEWRQKNNKAPAVDEDPNKPYTTMTIKNAQIVHMDNLDAEEAFIQDKFYVASSNPGVVHASFRNITKNVPAVHLKDASGNVSETPTKIEQELAAGVPVLLGLRIYCTPYKPGISLSRVYCIGDVKFRENKTEAEAASVLGKLGLQVSNSGSTGYVDTAANNAAIDFGAEEAEFDATGVMAAPEIPTAQPIQPVAQPQVVAPVQQAQTMPVQPQVPVQQAPVQPQAPISQAQALLNNYQPNGTPNPVAGQGYGTVN